MVIDRYRNRFVESTYDDGAPCVIGLIDMELVEKSSVPIYERLLSRLINIGLAYDLHIIPLFDVYNDTFFNKQQCENLLEELEFVEQVVNDKLLLEQVNKIRELATKCIRANGRLKLMIGGN